jgi:hypothetical protein
VTEIHRSIAAVRHSMPQPCVASFVRPSEALIAPGDIVAPSRKPGGQSRCSSVSTPLLAFIIGFLAVDASTTRRRSSGPLARAQRTEASTRTRPDEHAQIADCNVVMPLRRSVPRTHLQSPDARSMRAFQTVCGSYGDTRPRPPAVVRLMSPVQRFSSSNWTNNNSPALGAANSSLRTACPESGRLLESSNAGLFSTMLSRRTDRLANTMRIQSSTVP